ncbi:MAG: hypothetical protein SGI83_01280 [Bacteroidota bacterium]|nr:hypothetical protein [Bacteroidota bacterium]
MQNIWESIKKYYVTLGESYHVDPLIFVGIHVVATPLFIAAVAWLISNYRKNKSIFLPAIVAVLIFNAANIYLVIMGRNIPWWIYTILGVTTILSSYFSYKKVRKKINAK